MLTAAVLIPALRTQPFDSVAEIDPAEIKSLRVQLLNRKELDGGEDVGPYYADPADYPKLLEPLKGLPPVNGFAGATGPWLGEYRVLLNNGRKATLKLYWHRPPTDRPDAPARVRLRLDERREFEGGTAAAVIAAVAECEGRGRAKP